MSDVTMTRVAQQAGVSVSTVSHVVNGTRPVAPATREAVLAAMDRLGFVHKPVSRSLAAGSTRTIGVALPWSGNMFGQELAAGIEAEAARQGVLPLVAETGDDPAQEERVIANLLAHHVDGLILAPSRGWGDAALRLVQDRSVPVVLMDRFQDVPFDQVGVENEGASASLVEHLLSLGHRRVGIVTGAPGLSTTTERLAGYRSAHARRRLPVDEALVVCGDSTEQGGRRATARLLRAAAGSAPTALFVTNGAMTLGALRALGEAGLDVPGDVALVCFDEFPWSDVFRPRLTSVAQPHFAMGARAVQLLRRRSDEREAPRQVLRLGGEIMHRDSCGCRRPADADV